MKDMFDDRDEEKFEDDFFHEDQRKNRIRLIISLGTMFVMVMILLAVLLLGRKEEKDRNDIQDSIVEYAKEKESGFLEKELPEETPDAKNEIIDRNEEEISTPKPTPTPEILPTPTPEAAIMETDVKDYSKVKYDTKANLKEMEAYFKEGNFEALYDLSHLDRFIAMSYSFRDTTDFAYYGDLNSEGKPSGKGIAVYADNEYYYGDWVDGVREGEGLWLHYHIHLKQNLLDTITFHQYQGHFSNDLPNGPGQDHYEYDPLLLMDSTVYFTNYMGEYKDGLISGSIYMTATDKTGQYYEYDGVASVPGSFDLISESVDKLKRSPVMTDRSNPDGYYWMTKADNRNIGVKGYISSNKK